MILDLNQSTYYYSSNVFKPENRRLLFEDNLKKPKRSYDVKTNYNHEDLKDVESHLTDSIIYVKAPLSGKCLTKNKEATLASLFAVLDEFLLHSETFTGSFTESSLSEEEPIFDHYILVH
mmetsp:Transcript_22669/g.26029  ORF Transcript_22669/g.26029 Transcript_22669/m.26029 type:complete len:120 (+) Transcript_22669:249-608(+)